MITNAGFDNIQFSYHILYMTEGQNERLLAAISALEAAELLDPRTAGRVKDRLDRITDPTHQQLRKVVSDAFALVTLGHRLSVPQEAFECVSTGAQQLMRILIAQNGIPINARDLWQKLELTNEKEPFTALYRFVHEVNERLSLYGQIQETGHRGRPFYWKPTETQK